MSGYQYNAREEITFKSVQFNFIGSFACTQVHISAKNVLTRTCANTVSDPLTDVVQGTEHDERPPGAGQEAFLELQRRAFDASD